MTPLEKREQLIRMFGAYSVRLEQIFDDYYNRLARIGLTDDVLPLLEDEGSLFSFSRVPEVKSQLDNVFNDFVNRQMGLYRTGITDGAMLAIEHDSSLLGGYSVLSETALKTVRNNAVQGFLRGRLTSSRGLSLSQLVWNYAQQAKSEFEVAMSNVITQGLQEGTSAEELGRKVREQLNNPDMMYRRYHEKVVMADGSKKDVAIWRRRVIDEDGKVRFVKEPLEKVGMGHYRSARKNALRLMRTEINASYHNANYERWQQEPFVIGIRIFLSPQHPDYDECDELAGNYPKDFYWTGWHPQCMCAEAPITLQGDEKKDYYRRVALGENMSDYVSPNAITDVPDSYKEWIAANAERIQRADERGKLAWHLEDNREYWEDTYRDAIERTQKLGMTGSKLGRNATNEAYKYYSQDENMKPVIITDERQKDNLEDMAKALGIEVTPMSFIEADSGNANVVRDNSNCQSAVVAHEARIRGLNVTAAQYDGKEGGVFDELGKNTDIAWINPRNDRKPQLTILKDKGDGLDAVLEKNTSAVGRYHIGANYEIVIEGKPVERGHIITAQRFQDGRILYYDPQIDSFLNIAEFLEDAKSIEVLKVDKLHFNVDIVSQILTR